MGFRFFKRIKLMPGVTMNLSKSAPSFSFGPRGMKYTVGASGTRTTLGIPGTGLYYTKLNSRKKKNQDQAPPPPQSLAEAGFFRQLFSSPEEKSLLQGMRKFLVSPISSYICPRMYLAQSSSSRGRSFFLRATAPISLIAASFNPSRYKT
jgi:hypothetical protein